jgi:uncharacterized protein (TIGR02302 family)
MDGSGRRNPQERAAQQPSTSAPKAELPAAEQGARERIAKAVARAQAALLWESLWPRLAPVLTVVLLFLTASWFGLWRVLPDVPRVVVLGLFALAALATLVLPFRARLPGRAAALNRVERATDAPHRPATAVGDRLGGEPTDPVTLALWQAHRERVLASLGRLKAGIPAPGLARRDPVALRFLLVLLAVVAFLQAGPERSALVADAFRGNVASVLAEARIDAWATPPSYTARPPIFLTGERAKQQQASDIGVPQGSVVTVRIAGRKDVGVAATNETGALAEVEAAAPANPAAPPTAKTNAKDDAPTEFRVTLDRSGVVAVRRGEQQLMAWHFAVQPDAPPRIAFRAKPETAVNGVMKIAYTLSDDYGVVSAQALIEPLDPKLTAAGARPLFTAPPFPLNLPTVRVKQGNGETSRDLASHPWAGAKVRVTLIAKDEAGQEGRSDSMEVVLPARPFTDPVAKAVVEQRRNLAMDARQQGRVVDALGALTIAPEKYYSDLKIFLGLDSAYRRTVAAKSDDDLKGVVEYLWNLALGIEDGDLSDVERNLRQAQEALQKALENGASDEEIKRLTDQLREAMNKYMQALAEEMRKNQNLANLSPPPNAEILRPQDLNRMLDRIEQLARSGSRDAAKQMLQDLQRMMQGLQAGRMQQRQQGNNQAAQMLNELGDMIRRQQELMDKTFRLNRNQQNQGGQRNPGQQGNQANRGQQGDQNGDQAGDDQPMTPEELKEALRQLQEQQQALSQQLQDMMKKMEEMGLGQNPQMGQAGRQMGQAEGNLGNGRPGDAVGNQGAAIEALRNGMQSMMQMLAQQGQGQGPGQGFGFGQPYGPGGRQGFNNQYGENRDPLGRPNRDPGMDPGNQVKVPDEIDTQRAREILEDIRRRLGEANRPTIELDYLERLLQTF